MTLEMMIVGTIGGLAFGLLCVGVQGLRERGRGQRAMAAMEERMRRAVAANDRRWLMRILK